MAKVKPTHFISKADELDAEFATGASGVPVAAKVETSAQAPTPPVTQQSAPQVAPTQPVAPQVTPAIPDVVPATHTFQPPVEASVIEPVAPVYPSIDSLYPPIEPYVPPVMPERTVHEEQAKPAISPEIQAQLDELAQYKARALQQEREAALDIKNQSFDWVEQGAADEIVKKIVQPAFEAYTKPIQKELEETKARLEEERKFRLQQQQEQQRAALEARTRALDERIRQAHPDVTNIMNLPSFKQFLVTKAPDSAASVWDRMNDEYNRGNPEYAIAMISRFKQGSMPSAEAFASAPTAQVATRPSVPQPPVAQEEDEDIARSVASQLKSGVKEARRKQLNKQ